MTGNLLVTALGALLAAGIVAVPTAWLNDLGVMDAMVLVGWFWLLWLVPLAAMHALLSIVGRTAGRPLTPSQRAGVMWAAPVGLYWIVRLEPAHQWISFRPHLSMAAVLELGLLAAGTSVLVAAAVGGRPRQRAVHVVAATVMVCGCSRRPPSWSSLDEAATPSCGGRPPTSPNVRAPATSRPGCWCWRSTDSTGGR